MKKFAVSLFIDYISTIKTYIVLAKSIDDFGINGDMPSKKLLKVLELDVDPKECYVDVVSIEGNDIPSPYIIK